MGHTLDEVAAAGGILNKNNVPGERVSSMLRVLNQLFAVRLFTITKNGHPISLLMT